MNKLLIVLTSLLSVTGFASLFVPSLCAVYAVVSSILLAAVAVGGIKQLNDQESIDKNDILKEYLRQYKEKVATLEEKLIGQEKTIIRHEHAPQQSRPAPVEDPYW